MTFVKNCMERIIRAIDLQEPKNEFTQSKYWKEQTSSKRTTEFKSVLTSLGRDECIYGGFDRETQFKIETNFLIKYEPELNAIVRVTKYRHYQLMAERSEELAVELREKSLEKIEELILDANEKERTKK